MTTKVHANVKVADALVAIVLVLTGAGWAWAQEGTVRFRLLVTPTAEDTALLRDQVESGVPFDEIAREYSIDPSSATGGFMGALPANGLRPEYQAALAGLGPGETSQVFPISNAFGIVHLMDDAEERWMSRRAAGVDAFENNNLSGAEENLIEAVDLAAELGSSDVRHAQSLSELAGFYLLLNRVTDAEPLYRQALQIQERTIGRTHPAVAETLNGIAEVYRVTGRYSEAEPLLQRALGINQRTLGPDHPNVALNLNDLGLFYEEQGLPARALPLYQQAVGILEKSLEPGDPGVAAMLANLGRVHHAMGNYNAAEAAYRRAIDLLEPVVDPADPNFIELLRSFNAARRDQPLVPEGDIAPTIPLQ